MILTDLFLDFLVFPFDSLSISTLWQRSCSLRNIKEINTGVFAADAGPLKNWLSSLTDNNAQKELLLTDIVSHANASGFEVHAYKADDLVEVSGINTYTQLAKLERAVQNKQVEQLMEAGVQIMDPSRLDVRGSVNVGRGVIIDVNVLFSQTGAHLQLHVKI